MKQMNSSMKQKQTHRHRERLVITRGRGDEGGMDQELGLIDANYYTENG